MMSTAPLRKAGAHPRVCGQAVAKSVQPFADFLSGVGCHILGPRVDFDAGYDARRDEGLHEGRAIRLLLADRLVVEDRAADKLAEPGAVTINSR